MLLFFISMTALPQTHESPVLFEGYLTFWTRTCDRQSCSSLPTALGPSIAIKEVIPPPVEPNTFERFKVTVAQSEFIVQFSIMWLISSEKKPFTVTHVLLTSSDELRRYAECTQYSAPLEIIPFPVGTCSGFFEGSSKTNQIGVTFSRVMQN